MKSLLFLLVLAFDILKSLRWLTLLWSERVEKAGLGLQAG